MCRERVNFDFPTIIRTLQTLRSWPYLVSACMSKIPILGVPTRVVDGACIPWCTPTPTPFARPKLISNFDAGSGSTMKPVNFEVQQHRHAAAPELLVKFRSWHLLPNRQQYRCPYDAVVSSSSPMIHTERMRIFEISCVRPARSDWKGFLKVHKWCKVSAY